MTTRWLDALNRVCKWRRVFTGKMLGTAAESDPLIVGMNDIQEARIIMRVELTAITGLLLAKGVFAGDELNEAIGKEADLLNADYATRFPGFTATDDGIDMDVEMVRKTMAEQPWAK